MDDLVRRLNGRAQFFDEHPLEARWSNLQKSIDLFREAAREIERLHSFKPTHRHYKGGLYQLLHRAELESPRIPMVVYRDAEGTIWVRDSIEFFGTVQGGQLRFETIKEQ